MDHYYDNNLPKYAGHLHKAAPDVAKAYQEFGNAALRGEDRVIPPKYLELIALATALSTRCPLCIEAHTVAAKKLGATEVEVAETVFVASNLLAGAAFAHGFIAMKAYNQE